jgi:type VI secretion system protein ImpB
MGIGTANAGRARWHSLCGGNSLILQTSGRDRRELVPMTPVPTVNFARLSAGAMRRVQKAQWTRGWERNHSHFRKTRRGRPKPPTRPTPKGRLTELSAHGGHGDWLLLRGREECTINPCTKVITIMLEKDAQKRVARTYKGPRVHIGVEVDDRDAIPKREIPFVVGVLAPLSGSAATASWPAQQAVEINRLSFNDVMKKISPQVQFPVQGEASKTLTFEKMEDFEPENIAEEVVPDLLARRKALRDLLNRLSANPRLLAEIEALARERMSTSSTQDSSKR